MTMEEIIAKHGMDRDVLETSVISNGFSKSDSFTDQEVHLLVLYVDYLDAQAEVREQRRAFKYTDGEESIDKTSVFDNYRRYAMDMLAEWRRAKAEYDAQDSGTKSFVTIRKRARFLNE